MAFDVVREDDGDFRLINENAAISQWDGIASSITGMSLDQILDETNLDWNVARVPLFMKSGEDLLEVPKKRALIRDTDNRVFDIVSDTWNEVQHRDALKTFMEIAEKGKMSLDRAGAFNDGQFIWAQARINKEVEIVKGDVVKAYLLMSVPHKFGQSYAFGQTHTRVACENSLAHALGGDNIFKFNHSKTFDHEHIMAVVTKISDDLEKLKESGSFLSRKNYTPEELTNYLREVFPIENAKKLEESRAASICRDIIETQPGSEFARGTWWQAFNTVTFYQDHLAGNDNDKRLYSSWFGPSAKLKNDALGKAIKYAEAA